MFECLVLSSIINRAFMLRVLKLLSMSAISLLNCEYKNSWWLWWDRIFKIMCIYSNNKCMHVFFISPVPIAEPLTSDLIDTPVFHNLAPRPIKYRVSIPIPINREAAKMQVKQTISFFDQFKLKVVGLNIVFLTAYQRSNGPCRALD